VRKKRGAEKLPRNGPKIGHAIFDLAPKKWTILLCRFGYLYFMPSFK
jgi:hypothetical protein